VIELVRHQDLAEKPATRISTLRVHLLVDVLPPCSAIPSEAIPRKEAKRIEENLPETKDVPATVTKHTKEEHVSNERFRTKVLLRSEQTNDQVSVIENLVPAGWGGPPLHHHDFDETFYVLEGELTFQLGEEIFTRTQGGLAFAPRGAHHTLANQSGVEARYVLVCTPAGFERRFDLMAAEQAGVEPPPEARKPIPETIFVGPRIGERQGDGT
jgi:mannose-6-phosphate isomerase-like protein (cupin superfamily)